ncbi:hypothetical protein [Massilia glaciei]|uniref:Uncharacterized protein n=1 Tax=Massilia glaciei TaxID=1524097 RepID=A0A2U2HBY4_9BURK|nr:hypothetical protein [Massilia glaciei]PWF40363.1 hypothetical protein C7C56_026350 [Massilia glaciei]
MNKKRLALLALALVVVGLGLFIRHKAKGGDPFWIAAGWLLTAVVVLRVGLALRRGLKLFRAQTAAEGVTLQGIDKLTTSAMPPWMRSYYTIEKKVYGGFWRALTRKPLAAAPGFTVANGPRGTLVRVGLLLGIAVLLCAPSGFGHLVPETRLGLLAGVLYYGPVLYALVWVIGMRRVLRESAHRVTADAVELDLGVRASATVAAARIVRCGALLVPLAQYRAMHQIDSNQVWTVAPLEKANVLISLDAVAALETVWFGYPKTVNTQHIALYVDEPHAFVDALSALIPAGADERGMQNCMDFGPALHI